MSNRIAKTNGKTRAKKGEAEGCTISLHLGRVRDFAAKKARNQYDGNISLYIRKLVERDMVLEGK